MDDDKQFGQPWTSRSEPMFAWVKYIIMKAVDWRWEVAEEDAIFTGSCHVILMEDLAISAIVVSILLTDNQKLEWSSIQENLLLRANYVKLSWKRVITGDKNWVYGYDTKNQSSHWKSHALPCCKSAQ
jgi:hypothetical protein